MLRVGEGPGQNDQLFQQFRQSHLSMECCFLALELDASTQTIFPSARSAAFLSIQTGLPSGGGNLTFDTIFVPGQMQMFKAFQTTFSASCCGTGHLLDLLFFFFFKSKFERQKPHCSVSPYFWALLFDFLYWGEGGTAVRIDHVCTGFYVSNSSSKGSKVCEEGRSLMESGGFIYP